MDRPGPLRRPSWLRPRLLVVDGALALALGLVEVLIAVNLEDLFRDEDLRHPTEEPLLWLLVLLPASMVPLRRQLPGFAVIVGSLGQGAMWASAVPDYYLTTAFLLFSAAAHGGTRGRRAAGLSATALTAFTTLGWAVGQSPPYTVAVVGLFSVTAVSLGNGLARRQAYLELADARAIEAARAAVERERLAGATAVSEERNRIAREVHDIVAHGISVMVVQAEAATRVFDSRPDDARAALVRIQDTGRTALRDMRQILGALRTDDDDDWRPTPGLGAVGELVEELAGVGLQVEVSTQDPGTGPLPTPVDVTAYRVVQESLTNVLKHAGPGARATVTISREPGHLLVAVSDDGRGTTVRTGTDGNPGHGLLGMRERVMLFGGRFRAGPGHGGGYHVEVALPLDGPGGTDRPTSREVGADLGDPAPGIR